MELSDIPFQQLISLWLLFSVFIVFLWGLMIEGPDTSDLQVIILSIICGILALPLTLIIVIVLLCIYLVTNINNFKNK